MPQPPLLPAEVLARVLRLAKFDGMSALALGGLFALSAAAGGHFPLTAIGLLAAGAGAVELHGVALLRQGERRGMKWLIASQPFLLVVILTYAALRLWLLEVEQMPESMRALLALSAAQWRMAPQDFVVMLNRIMAIAVGLGGLVFQGAMTVYYVRRKKAVERALAQTEDTL